MIALDGKYLATVRDILKTRIPGREVWVFGSRVRGRCRKYSDLDLAVIGNKPLAAGLFASLLADFEESDLPIKVDVVDWAAASRSFREIIRENHAVLQTMLRNC